jgi:hypothetical protein
MTEQERKRRKEADERFERMLKSDWYRAVMKRLATK